MSQDGLLLLSGGMDSVTMLHQFKDDIVLCLSFNYGSKHSEQELKSAGYFASRLLKNHIVIDLNFINDFFSSSLLKSGNEIPEGHYQDETMKSTVVPFRNGILLSIAAGIAESRAINKIYIANHFGDHAIFPDCRESFVKPMKEAIETGTYNGVELVAPYTHINKRAIALRGQEMAVKYEKTWTCYKGGAKHCGSCGSCVERQEALAGFDLTEYER